MGTWKYLACATVLVGLALGGCKRVDGYDRERGFCKVVQEYTTEIECNTFQAQLESLNPYGKAAFNAPNPMKRGDTVTVTLAVADTPPPEPESDAASGAAASPPTEVYPAPPPPTQTAAASVPAPKAGQPPPQEDAPRPEEVIKALAGRTQQYTLSVGPRMTADLDGDVGFQVKARSARAQRVHMGPPYPSTLWTWDVKAKHGGPHTLTITTAVQAIDQKGRLHELSATPQAFSFTVTVDWLGSLMDRAEIWADEISGATAFVRILTAFVTALSALLAALGIRHLWRRRHR